HEHLKETLPEIDESIKYVIPFILDDVSANLGPWSGYHLLAQNPISLLHSVNHECSLHDCGQTKSDLVKLD
ncbi:MAG: hypothetical protein PHV63_04370, partial [Candidatus Daviesbacteria bacterium]|nr:hypothetical protein [Candidatus Daviesbacteria bacterium]